MKPTSATPLSLAIPILAALALMTLAGCGHLNALVRANDIERQAKIDRLKFIETMRDAYLLIGNEYYKLAKIAEDRGDAKKTKEYTAQASLYAILYNDLKTRAREVRDSLESNTRASRSSGSEEENLMPEEITP